MEIPMPRTLREIETDQVQLSHPIDTLDSEFDDYDADVVYYTDTEDKEAA